MVDGLFVLLAGVVLYLGAMGIMRWYIVRHDPTAYDKDRLYGPLEGGEYRWQKAAREGAAPRWVAWISTAGLVVGAFGIYLLIKSLFVTPS